MAKRRKIAKIIGTRGYKANSWGERQTMNKGTSTYRYRGAYGVKPRHRRAQGVKPLPKCGHDKQIYYMSHTSDLFQHLNLNIFQCIDFFLSSNLKNDPPRFNFHHQFLSFLLVCYKENKWHFSSFLKINFWRHNNSFTTSLTSKEIPKLKYSVSYANYKTSVLLLLIIVAKKKA